MIDDEGETNHGNEDPCSVSTIQACVVFFLSTPPCVKCMQKMHFFLCEVGWFIHGGPRLFHHETTCEIESRSSEAKG